MNATNEQRSTSSALTASATAHELGQKYDADFYDDLAREVRSSAEVIVPIVIDLLHPASVLDIGCGRGTWLEVFRSHGVATIRGVDGPHVSATDLEMPPESFVTHDLTTPIDLGERFELVVSLEVGEHLDRSIAPEFVASLVAHAPAVLFSAAVPFQGGAGHVNEQWPSYWCNLFEARGYRALDLIRPIVWNDPRVAFWYAQNTILYVDTHQHEALVTRAGLAEGGVLDLVHPSLHTRDHTAPKRPAPQPSLSRVLRDLPGAVGRAARSRVARSDRTTHS
jgi:hypothetical protein